MLGLGLFPQVGPSGTAVLVIFLAGLFFGTRWLWRVPLLLLLCSLLLLDFVVYFSVRCVVRFFELLLTARMPRRRSLHRQMKKAKTYAEWSGFAQQLDTYEKRQEWKESEADKNYAVRVVRAAVTKLRDAQGGGDVLALVDVIRPCLVKNFGGVMNYEMYTQAHCGTKVLIDSFVNELESSLKHLAKRARELRRSEEAVLSAEAEADLAAMRQLVNGALQSFGRTSLLLSGGAGLGFYHFGILRALLAENALPRVLCGTSMGSIVLSFLASRTDEEALNELTNIDELYAHTGAEGGPLKGSMLWKAWRVLRRGYVYDTEGMSKHVEYFTKGMTFQEAFEKSGRAINITCTPKRTRTVRGLPPLLLNHLTAPRVTITSAVLASSCVPCLIPPVLLMEKGPDGSLKPYQGIQGSDPSGESLDMVQMRDGSFQSDVPVQAMGAFFNSQFNIVSQVNPHIIPFFFNAKGAIGRPIRWPWVRHRGGFLAFLVECWCKEDMIKLLKVMRTTDMLFSIFGVDWSYLFLQEAQGDITMVPHAGLRDYSLLLHNVPSKAHLSELIRQSERSAWRHFPIIRNRMRLERALEELEDALGVASFPGPDSTPADDSSPETSPLGSAASQGLEGKARSWLTGAQASLGRRWLPLS